MIAGAYKKLKSVSLCFRNINSFDPHNTLRSRYYFTPYFTDEETGPDRLMYLLKVAQLGEAELVSIIASHWSSWYNDV